jgi:hypothetical protein
MHRVMRVVVVMMMVVMVMVMRPAMNRCGKRRNTEGRQQGSDKDGLDLHGGSPIRRVRIAPNLSSGPTIAGLASITAR